MAIQHRAIVRIRGAENQFLYGSSPERLRARAYKCITKYPPGWADLYPKEVELQERVEGTNPARWRTLEIIPYATIACAVKTTVTPE